MARRSYRQTIVDDSGQKCQRNGGWVAAKNTNFAYLTCHHNRNREKYQRFSPFSQLLPQDYLY
jgi:hypothetical protein